MTDPWKPFDTRCYQVLLALYPPAFRREFGDEMRKDFDLGLIEARGNGPDALRAFRCHATADGLAALVVQWMRSGWPLIVALSVVVPFATTAWLASIWRRSLFVMPEGARDIEVLGIVLLASVSIVIIAATIIVTVRFTPPHLRRRTR